MNKTPSPECAMQRGVDDLKAKQRAERIEAGLCWVNGGMINHDPTPTVIHIDVPVSSEHRGQLWDILKNIELKHSGG